MSLIEAAKLNGHDSLAYLKNILFWLPTQPNSRISRLRLESNTTGKAGGLIVQADR